MSETSQPMADSFRYHPFYCEENAWWLCQHPEIAKSHPQVVFISNEARQCLMHEQRAAAPGDSVVWDYHVIVLAQGNVWDLDTRMGAPVPLTTYLAQTFPRLPDAFQHLAPMFRVIDAASFLDTFQTDRAHMRRADGSWLQPPPPWDPPGVGGRPNQLRFATFDDPIAGEVLDLAGLAARYSR